MMPTIRIDEDVFKRLQALAEPFTDTPNTVICRLLDERDSAVTLSSTITHRNREEAVQMTEKGNFIEERDLIAKLDAEFGKKRRPTGLTPQPVYETFLLHVLANTFRGRGEKHEVTKAALDFMKSRGYVNNADLERVSTGETKAENTIAWARNALKDNGLISRVSPRGVWELTPKGLASAKSILLPTNDK